MLALADSVLELYSAADLATVEAGVLDLAISVVPCGVAGLAATRAGAGMVAVSDPVVDEAEQRAAIVVARHASVAIAARRREPSLRQAMESHSLVGRAQGLLMERFGIDTVRAFAILRRYSQDHNIKLTEVAASLLSNRDLPSPLRDADGRIHR